MRRRFLLWVVIFAILTISANAQVKVASRNKIDFIKITKITPRSLSFLPKPINMPIHLEVEYDLKSQKTGKVVITVYKVQIDKKNRVSLHRMSGLTKVFKVNRGRRTIRHVTPPVRISKRDDATILLTVASLLDKHGNEVAFSSSKNIISGTYKIFLSNKKPTRDFIRRISISPPTGSDISTGKLTKFSLILQYSLKSRPVAYIDVLFTDISELGTGRCWKVVTVAVPKSVGKVKINPVIEFNNSLAGRNMGIDIFYWLDPLKAAYENLRVVEYFLKK